MIKKNNKIKDGLQGYRVRVFYKTKDGIKSELSGTAYGMEQAKELEYNLKRQIREKTTLPSKQLTILDLYEEYIESKQFEVRESSLLKSKQILRCNVLDVLGDCKLDKLGSKELREWKLFVEKRNLKPVSKKNVYTELRTMLNYAIKMEYLQTNPLKKVGNFKSPLEIESDIKFYTPEEFKAFIAVARDEAEKYENEHNSLYEWNYYVFFNIAFYSGLRKGEIHGLQWDDINGKYLSVKRSVAQKLGVGEDIESAPKNASSRRTIQIPKPLITILEEHKRRQKQTGCFSNDSKVLGNGKCLRDNTLSNKNKKYAQKADVKRIRIHDYRHSHASLLANEGVNIQEIARRLGHSNVEITWNTYSHLYPKAEEHAISVLNNI